VALPPALRAVRKEVLAFWLAMLTALVLIAALLWVNVAEPEESSRVPAPTAAPPVQPVAPAPQTYASIEPAGAERVYQVVPEDPIPGESIVPGQYYTEGPVTEGTATCYFARIRDVRRDGTVREETVQARTVAEDATILVKQGDKYLQTSGCKSWKLQK
jgi:hypothetical protein